MILIEITLISLKLFRGVNAKETLESEKNTKKHELAMHLL